MAVQTQVPAVMVSQGDSVPYTPANSGINYAGDIVLLGAVVGICTDDINTNGQGALGGVWLSGVFTVPKDTSSGNAGDALYWNATGNPVVGTAGTGCFTTTASGNNLAGIAVPTPGQSGYLTGDATVRIKLQPQNSSGTTGGVMTATSITGTSSTLPVQGLGAAQGGSASLIGGTSTTSANAGGAALITGGAPGATGVGGAVTIAGGAGGATSGAGGAVSITGGVGTAGNAAGGAATLAGGAGQGTANGGILTLTAGASGVGATGAGAAFLLKGGAALSTNGAGGAGVIAGGAGAGTGAGGALSNTGGASGTGATGNGGAVSLVGGAALSTNGTGGAATITGGVATGTGTGGALTLTAGASGGSSGTAGQAALDCGSAAAGTGVPLLLADANATATYLNRGPRAALQVGLTLAALGSTQSSAPTAAQLLGGLLTQASGTGAGVITLPTGTALAAACARVPVAGDSFDVMFANIGTQTLTVTGATGTTVAAGTNSGIVESTCAILKFYCTGTNAFTIYTKL